MFNDCFVEVEVLAEDELIVVLGNELPDAFFEFGGEVDIVAVTGVEYLEAHDNFGNSADGGVLAQVLRSGVVDPALGGGHAGVTEAPHHGSQGRRGSFASC